MDGFDVTGPTLTIVTADKVINVDNRPGVRVREAPRDPLWRAELLAAAARLFAYGLTTLLMDSGAAA